MALKWNRHNGNWLISASRDNFCKLFDIRNLKEEVQCFRGHKKEACSKRLTFRLYCIDVYLLIFHAKIKAFLRRFFLHISRINNKYRFTMIVIMNTFLLFNKINKTNDNPLKNII